MFRMTILLMPSIVRYRNRGAQGLPIKSTKPSLDTRHRKGHFAYQNVISG